MPQGINITHLHCLAVQAGFYSGVVDCLLNTRKNLVRSPSGKKDFSSVTFRAQRGALGSTGVLYVYTP